MLDENDVVNFVCSYLKKNGWSIEQKLSTSEQGIDVIAENPKSNCRVFVEAKGGTSSRKGSERFGKPYTSSQVFNRVSKGFFTIAKLRQEDPKTSVCLAVPDTPCFKKYISQIESGLSQLDLNIFWVEDNGNVVEWPKTVCR